MSHSVILGGSNAERLLACPASYQEALKVPVVDVESSYAAEGTMLHEVQAINIKRKVTAQSVRDVGISYKGKLPYTLTEEQEEALAKALDALEEVKAAYPGDKPWRVLALESRVSLPGVTGAFGTVDLILSNDTTVIVVDWKFGSGVPVHAVYNLPDGSSQINAQGAFYACCARAAFPRQFKGKRIVIAVIQPRLDPAYSHVETDEEELTAFHNAFAAAVLEAMGRNAHRERGEHCRFALCISTCPLFTGPVLDLAVLDPTKAALIASAGGSETEYGAFLSRALTLAELAEIWAAEIRRQAHVFIEDGGKVREWKLVPKRGTRQWIGSEDEVVAALTAAGAKLADLYSEPELKSVNQVEKSLKPKKLAVPPEMYEMVSTGTTIARSDDPRPESSHAQVLEDVRAALKAL
jgi:hypothetical protein